jgi:hypothetical protein
LHRAARLGRYKAIGTHTQNQRQFLRSSHRARAVGPLQTASTAPPPENNRGKNFAACFAGPEGDPAISGQAASF